MWCCCVPDTSLPTVYPNPPASIMLNIVLESYKAEPGNVPPWSPIAYSSSLTIYTDGVDYVVGVRGTATLEDIEADALIPLNELDKSMRWMKDWNFLSMFQSTNPGIYFGAGHSLGGSIIDLFLRCDMLHGARSYNPTIQPGDLVVDGHQRVYNDCDPLYLLIGRLDRKAIVRKNTSSFEPHSIDSFSESE